MDRPSIIGGTSLNRTLIDFEIVVVIFVLSFCFSVLLLSSIIVQQKQMSSKTEIFLFCKMVSYFIVVVR